jgi:hypothetical protein
MPAAAIIGVGMAVGGIASAIGSSSAAHAQERAAQQATQVEQSQYAQTRADLMPFQQSGQQANNQLMAQMGYLTSPFNPTQAQLEATPGYQFNLAQGLKSVNNAMGARGLLNSGAVMKGASQYATGLADSTYLDQFNVDQTNKINAYNKLMGVAQLGEGAAAQTGAFGLQTAQEVAGNFIGAGNARAAGDMGIANGIGQVANGLSTAFLPSSFLQSAINPFGNSLFSKTGIFGGVPSSAQTASGGVYYGGGTSSFMNSSRNPFSQFGG